MVDEHSQEGVEAFDLRGAMLRAKKALTPGVKDAGGDPEGVVDHPDLLDKHYPASAVILCKDIADQLSQEFPGWAWAVQPDPKGGIINIWNLHCHNELGYTIHGDLLDNAKVRKREVRKAGGEILERFRMPSRLDRERVAEAPRDARGRMIPDLRGLNMVRQKMNAEIAMAYAEGRAEVVHDLEGNEYLRIRQ